jgi:membrane-associated phospholipid phosphatase
MKRIGVLTLLLWIGTSAGRAQTDSLRLTSVVARDAKTAFAGAVHIITAPGRWHGGDWARTGVAAGIAAGSVWLDADVRTLIQRNADAADGLSNVAATYGNGWFAVGLTTGLYGTGVIVHDSWLRETALLAGTAVVVSSLIARAIKPVVGRARPYVGTGNGTFHMFTLQDDYSSFPSGHTVAAFSLSSVLAARIDHPLATIGLYSLACLTALSRVYTDQHWFSDVVVGGIFASAVGRSLVLWHEGIDAGPSSLRIAPGDDRICLIYTF